MPKTFWAAIGAAVVLTALPAYASQDCAADLQALSARREAALKSINELVASAHGKKLDPDAFCSHSRPLNSAEEAMLAYMQKNKDWCQIPDEAIAQLKDTHLKSVAFGGKACTVAAQIRTMKAKAAQQAQQAQQAGGGQPAEQPLPAGPL
jgi:hypothetical protein